MIAVHVQSDLGRYRGQWDDLVLAQATPPTDLRSWWLEGIADAESRFVLVADGDRLLGGVAVNVRRRWGVTHLELLGNDYYPSDIDVVADASQIVLVVIHLGRWLRSHRHGTVDLDGVRERSLLLATVPAGVDEVVVPGAPFVTLSGTFAEYLAGRSTNLRSSVKRQSKRLEGEGVTYRRLAPEELPLGLMTLRELHGDHFGAQSSFTPHFERFQAAARAGVACGELVFHALSCEDRLIATIVTMEVGRHVSWLQSGMASRDERRFHGAGTVLLAKVLQGACEQGMLGVDLGRDPSAHKARWTEDIRPVRQLVGSWGGRPESLEHLRNSRDQIYKDVRRIKRHAGHFIRG
jgi:hypothetical protein